jgi:hypothetical protein
MLHTPVSSQARCTVGLALLLALGAACAQNNSPGGNATGSGGSSGGSNTGGRGGSAGGSSGSGSGGSAGSGQGGSAGSGQGGSAGSGSGGSGTGGSAGSGQGGSAGSGAGGSTGGTGTGGGSGDMAGAEAEPAACAGPNLAAGNRCAVPAQVFKGMGNEPLIDDMEPTPGETMECHKIRAVDGRQGIWNFGKDATSPNGAVTFKLEAPGAGGKAGSTRAIRFNGQGLNGYGGYLATPLAPCYDASAYKGISFWMKGDPAKAPFVKVAILTPYSSLADEGGKCVQGAGAGNECYDHFAVPLFRVASTWTRYSITWQQLGQAGWGQKIPTTVQPEKEIIGISFSPVWSNDAAPNKSFDFALDDISFEVNGPFADTGFQSFVSKSMFDGAYASRRAGAAAHPLYGNAYQDIIEVLNDPRFSRLFREGSVDDRKRELAGFLAHLVQESGSLRYVEEINKEVYCRPQASRYPCAAGKSYFGRGPMQLTGNDNYGPFGEFLGMPSSTFLNNPERVAGDAKLAWQAAFFFWMGWKDTGTNVLQGSPHATFLNSGFSATINAVNGPLECPSSQMAENRKVAFREFCQLLGVGGCETKPGCM